MRVYLPHLGWRHVERAIPKGHYLWLDNMGWHDCTPNEDRIIEHAKIQAAWDCQ